MKAMKLGLHCEDVVNVIGLMLVLTVIISAIEFVVINKVSYISLITGLTLAIIITYYTRKHYGKREIDNYSKLGLVLALTYMLIIVSTYYVYPIFPANRSGDFLVYIKDSLKFATGEATLKDLITLHPAIYLLLGTVLSLNILNPLVLTRFFMLMLTILSIPLIYEVSMKFYGKFAGELALLLSIFINIFWYYTVIITGLYANFLGLMMALYLLYLISRYVKDDNRVYLILAIPTTLVMLMSHETTFAVLLALWLSSIHHSIVKKNLTLIKTSATLSAPLILIPILIPASLKFILNFIENYILKFKVMQIRVLLISPVNPIYNTLKVISPLLANTYASIGISGLILTLVCMISGIVLILKKQSGLQLIPWYWLVILWITSYFTTEFWRLALNATIPVTLFASLISKQVLLKININIDKLSLKEHVKKILKYELAAFTITLLFITSNISLALTYNYSKISETHELQYGVLEAMQWLKENTPENAKIISIARWHFMYAPYIVYREFIGDYALGPNQLFNYVKSRSNETYVVVWNKIRNETMYYVSLYESSPLYRKIWYNKVVTIFITH